MSENRQQMLEIFEASYPKMPKKVKEGILDIIMQQAEFLATVGNAQPEMTDKGTELVVMAIKVLGNLHISHPMLKFKAVPKRLSTPRVISAEVMFDQLELMRQFPDEAMAFAIQVVTDKLLEEIEDAQSRADREDVELSAGIFITQVAVEEKPPFRPVIKAFMRYDIK